MPNIAADFENPVGVPIDGIIFGGRTSDREPLIRAINDVAEGVYDGLTLGAEATFAADGLDGSCATTRCRCARSCPTPRAPYAAHWLKIIGAATDKPIFAHVNWFQRDPEDGHFLWPGYRDNLRAAAVADAAQERRGHRASRPRSASSAQGRAQPRRPRDRPGDLDKLLTIDTDRWKQEMGFRQAHLEQFANLPEAIWEAHRRVAKDLGD